MMNSGSTEMAATQPAEATQQALPAAPTTRTSVALGRPVAGGLAPKTLEEVWRIATIIAQSDLAPKDYRNKPGNVFVAVEMGMELGIPIMQAVQNIAVINGRPAIWGDLGLALVEASGLLVDHEESYEGTPGQPDFTAVCVMQRRGRKPRRVEFSMNDAKTAGLAGKDGPWKQYPKRMLQMRARWFCLRDLFPDVLKGVRAAEEVQDSEEAIETTVVVSDPKRQALIERLEASREAQKAPTETAPVVTPTTAKPAPTVPPAYDDCACPDGPAGKHEIGCRFTTAKVVTDDSLV